MFKFNKILLVVGLLFANISFCPPRRMVIFYEQTGEIKAADSSGQRLQKTASIYVSSRVKTYLDVLNAFPEGSLKNIILLFPRKACGRQKIYDTVFADVSSQTQKPISGRHRELIEQGELEFRADAL